ncbi:MAG: hypothetical protein P1U61_06220 [Legionellaceae bacterium]|nr:hypothetical protein [Legionellaceae bacterium]
MASSSSAFMDEKHLFFSSPPHPDGSTSSKSLTFLNQNHDAITQEKNLLKKALDTLEIDTNRTITSNEEQEQYRLWYLHCCDLLKTYHEKRGEPEKPPENWTNYIHDNLGYVHGFRILLTFSRITDELLIRIMNDAKWFDKLNQSIAPIFNFDQSITILNLPVQAFYILSFSLLGLRFLIELAQILKHTFNPTEQELAALTTWERFSHEIYKYRFNIANDIVWGVLNAINNNPLMLVCILFDLSLTLYRQRETHHAYLEKKTEYEQLLALKKQDEIIQQQLKELELDHIQTTATLKLALIATTDILIGLSMLLAAPIPIVAPIGAFLCVIGFAAHLSADMYGNYQKQTYLLKQLEDSGENTDIEKVKKEQQAAWNEGWSSFTKNAVLPTLFIGVFSIYWPAALLLVAAYTAYEMYPKEKAETFQLCPT